MILLPNYLTFTLLTSSFLEGLTLRFYSADSNYLDARVNAKSKAVQLLDKVELQVEEAKAELQMQQASQAKAKKLGLNTMNVTIDPNWPLCNQPNTENLCQQVIDFELEIYYDSSLGYIIEPIILKEFGWQLLFMGYDDYVKGKLTDISQLKTRNQVINDVSLAWSIVVSKYASLPWFIRPRIALLSVDVRSSCCPKKPVENLAGGLFAKDIRNRTNDPCISKTVEAVLRANKDLTGALAGIIQKFDESKSVTINIYDGETIKGTPGEYQGGGFVGGVFHANIRLQSSYFQNSSKESLIATLIHEFVHAYINTSGSPILQAQHDVIAANYINPMAIYLVQYFNISLKDAHALAWSGVPDATAFKNAPYDFEFTMLDGNKITKYEITYISSAYARNGIYADDEIKRGKPICN